VSEIGAVSGCISRLVVSGTPINLGADILDSRAISDCPVCTSRTCKNGGSCQAGATSSGFRCLCPRNYSGETCQLVGDRCTPSRYSVFTQSSNQSIKYTFIQFHIGADSMGAIAPTQKFVEAIPPSRPHRNFVVSVFLKL